jgi:hypothetical protein
MSPKAKIKTAARSRMNNPHASAGMATPISFGCRNSTMTIKRIKRNNDLGLKLATQQLKRPIEWISSQNSNAETTTAIASEMSTWKSIRHFENVWTMIQTTTKMKKTGKKSSKYIIKARC